MINVFQSEIDANISEMIQANNTVAYTCESKIVSIGDKGKDAILEKVIASQSNPNQFDLFYIDSILASIGWNSNDDIFDKTESWNARKTPVDKQFNFMHNQADIIGHITSSKVFDFDGGLIKDDTKVEDLPDKFDIVAGSVLYRYWPDPVLQTRMDELIEGIKNSEWCVSMECLFSNFDYGVVSPDGVHKVIARDNDSSFLSKHLRIYGGAGEYDGWKIGRLLRGFTFSGKGLVDNPANKRSLIINSFSHNDIQSFAGSVASVNTLGNKQEIKMTHTDEQYAALEAKLAKADASAKDAVAAKLDGYKTQVKKLKDYTDALEVEKTQFETDLATANEVKDAKEEKITSLDKTLAERDVEIVKLGESLTAIEQEKTKADRLAKLSNADITDERAAELVEKFTLASDEMFNELVNSLPAKAGLHSEEEDKKRLEAEKKKKKSKADTAIDDLNGAETEEGDSLVVGETDEKSELITAAASWIGGGLKCLRQVNSNA